MSGYERKSAVTMPESMDPSASGGKERKRPRSEAERIEDESAPEDQPMTFMQHDMGLDRRLVKAVAKMGFVYPTLVQSKCIPLALKGKDLLVRFGFDLYDPFLVALHPPC